MKTVVYRWRLSAKLKAELKAEARRIGISMSALLNRIVDEWLAQRRRLRSADKAALAARSRP
jgi:hypothetical protein